MKLASTTLLILFACHVTAFPSVDNEIQQTTGSQEFDTQTGTNQVKEAGTLSGTDTNHKHFNKCRYRC